MSDYRLWDYGSRSEDGYRRWMLGGLLFGLAIAAVLTPYSVAMRPREVVTVNVPSADILDVGAHCAYVLGGALRIWAKLEVHAPCPTRPAALTLWGRESTAIAVANQAVADANARVAAVSRRWQTIP